MRHRALIVVLLGTLASQTACMVGAVNGAPSRKERQENRARIGERFTYDLGFKHDGQARTYKVHVPPSYDGKTPMPVVMVFHGGFGDAYAAEMQSEMSFFADKAGFIVAYPEGLGKAFVPHLGRSWNGGTCCDPSKTRKIDDVGYVSALIDDLATKVQIDRGRVYATGLSNGAIMCYRLACDLADKITAIAPIGGPDATATCKPSRPVSIIHFHGVADPCSPYKGGPGGGCAARAMGLKPKPIFDTPSIPDIAKTWAERNGASKSGKVTLTKGAVSCTTYGPGREDSEVTLCSIEGGGHTWPGGVDKLDENLVGKVNKDISANEVMWEFFKRHARK